MIGGMRNLLDAHLHMTHSPLTPYPAEWEFFSCAAGPRDWSPLLRRENPGIRPFFGIHPETAPGERTEEVLDRLEELIRENGHAGIGEIGLDRRFYPGFPRKEQEDLVAAQLRLARRYERPVVFHQVRASGALAELLERWRPEVPFLLHGFREPPETARRFLNLGGYLSLGPGPHWKDTNFRTMVRNLPRERILLETDWPYLKGDKTAEEPGDYRKVLEAHYSAAAAVLGIDTTELIAIVRNNGTVFTH